MIVFARFLFYFLFHQIFLFLHSWMILSMLALVFSRLSVLIPFLDASASPRSKCSRGCTLMVLKSIKGSLKAFPEAACFLICSSTCLMPFYCPSIKFPKLPYPKAPQLLKEESSFL